MVSSEFEEMFGSTKKEIHSVTVEQYLRRFGQVTIVRVLNTGGYSDFVQVNMSGSGHRQVALYLHHLVVVRMEQ